MKLPDSKLKLAVAVAAAEAERRKFASLPYGEQLTIEPWLRHYFPDTFTRPFTSYQSDYWKWVAALRPDKAQPPRIECHPRGVGKCLAASTLVLLADGSQRPIAALQVGEKIISYRSCSHQWQTDAITAKWDAGIKQTLKVTTASGKVLTLTPEHRVLTLGGWTVAGKLTPDHYLAGCAGLSVSATAVQILSTPSPTANALAVGDVSDGTSAAAQAVSITTQGAQDTRVTGGDTPLPLPPTHPQTPLPQAGGATDGGRDSEPRVCLCSHQVWMHSWPGEEGKTMLGVCAVCRCPQYTESRGGGNHSATAFLCLPEAVDALQSALKDVKGAGVLLPSGTKPSDIYKVPSVAQAGIIPTRPQWVHTPEDPYALQWERVVSVDDGGEVHCWDVAVEKNQCLVTNGLVSHNSTGAEAGAVHALAKKAKKYVLYVSATDDQASKHLRAIKAKLENQVLLKDYPHLKPKIEKLQNKVANWSQDRLRLANGAIVECISLMGNARGFKSEDSARPDFIILDDIDSSKESIDVTKKKLDILATEVLPTGTILTDVLMPQNLIHRNSICAKILDGTAEILSNRVPSGPYPLVKNLQYERRDLPAGGSEWIITSGEPFDPAIGLDYSQHLLQMLGPDAFLRECHPAGTRVRVNGHLSVPIEEVQIGDLVVTHTGRERTVEETLSRQYTGTMYAVKRAGKREAMEATANHPVFAAKRPTREKWFRCHAKQPRADNLNQIENLTYQWMPVSDLKKGDYLLEPCGIEPASPNDGQVIWEYQTADTGRPVAGQKRATATPSLFRLIGYYLAEGSRSVNGVSFSFHQHENGFHDDVIALCREVFDVHAYPRKPRNGGIDVVAGSSLLRQFFEQFGLEFMESR